MARRSCSGADFLIDITINGSDVDDDSITISRSNVSIYCTASQSCITGERIGTRIITLTNVSSESLPLVKLFCTGSQTCIYSHIYGTVVDEIMVLDIMHCLVQK